MSVNKVNQSTGELSPIAGGTLYADAPVGSIQAYGGTTAPWGWLICNGAAISRTTYAELFGVIGTSFGAGDGSTTFNIPDLRGEFLRGAGTNSHSGQGDGGAVGEHQNGTNIATSIMGNGYGVIYNMINGFIDSSTYDKWVGNSGNTYLHNTTGQETESYASRIGIGKARPTNTSVNFIIKATTISLPSDFEAAVDDKIATCKKIGDVFFSNDFRSSGTAPSFAATASHTITIAGTYFVYVSGNPYATDTDMTATIQYNNVNVGFNSITNSAAANYSIISCVCMVQASVGGVISVGLTGATNAGGYNHYGIFRIA